MTMMLLGLAAASAQAAVPTEYQVKAAFLFNFTKFVEWPPNRFANDDAPIVIAILGSNPFGDELENLVRNRFVNRRPIVVRMLASAEAARSGGAACHVLFVPAGAESRFAAYIDAAPRAGLLTVGESERFAALGGMVNFTVVEGRMRFEINRAAAEVAGLKLRAQLQKLAAPVRAANGDTLP